MTVITSEGIRWGIQFFFFLFHLSVTWFMFYMMVIRKDKMYISSFFTLYLMISVADEATIINNALVHKAIRVDSWKPWFFDHPQWDNLLWPFSGYLIYLQSILHASIAINRAWISYSFMGSNSTEILPKIGKVAIFLIPFAALAIVSPRFAGNSYYFYTSNGELASTYKELHVQAYHSIAGPSVVLSASSISFILAVSTILRYRYIFKQFNTFSSSIKQDLLLFVQAIVMLIFQLGVAAFYVMRLIAIANNLTNLLGSAADYFDYVTDALSLCNPIALLIVCKFIKKDYINLIFRRKSSVKVGGAASTESRPKTIVTVS